MNPEMVLTLMGLSPDDPDAESKMISRCVSLLRVLELAVEEIAESGWSAFMDRHPQHADAINLGVPFLGSLIDMIRPMLDSGLLTAGLEVLAANIKAQVASGLPEMECES